MNMHMLPTCVLVEQPLVVHALPAGLHCRLPQGNLLRDVAVAVARQAALLHAVAICRGAQQELASFWVITKHKRPLMLTQACRIDVSPPLVTACAAAQRAQDPDSGSIWLTKAQPPPRRDYKEAGNPYHAHRCVVPSHVPACGRASAPHGDALPRGPLGPGAPSEAAPAKQDINIHFVHVRSAGAAG